MSADIYLPLAGKAALVTGAGRGIGRSIAVCLAKWGARVLCVSRTEVELDETLRLTGDSGRLCVADIADNHAAMFLVETMLAKFQKIDILVHSAGIMPVGSVHDMSRDYFAKAFTTNVEGPYALTQAALPHLATSKGDILFVNSSITKAANTAGRGVFAATQAALKALADSIRDEVNESGVRVASIMPGTTATPRQAALFAQAGREYRPDLLLQADDVAQAACASLLLPRTAETTDIYVRPMIKYTN